MRAWAEEYAKKNGWVLNPDKKILDTVFRGLVRNKKKSGEQYCPCRLCYRKDAAEMAAGEHE